MKLSYKALLIVSLVLAAIVVTLGAYVRLEDAGLGCPDWPGCYGHWVGIPDAAHEVSAAESAFPHAPVEAGKAWKEMIHRYAASVLGLCIIGLTFLGWKRSSSDAFWTRFLLVLVIVQGALGMWTVTLLLKPVIVTLHLLGGLSVLAILLGLAWRERMPAASTLNFPRLRWAVALVLGLVMVQIALGGWTSTNYAAMACPDYPTCKQSWIPSMDWEHAFVLTRELGQTATGEGLPLDALVAIHWTHRWFAMVVVVAVLLVGWRLMMAHQRLVGYGLAMIGAVLLQWAIGVANVWLEWPLLLAVLHNTGAALLLTVVLATVVRLSPGKRFNA